MTTTAPPAVDVAPRPQPSPTPAPAADSVRITFHGGVGTVTGSRHLLEAAGHRILIDCGMFQGLKPLRLLNWQPPPFDPATIDALVLTHAHMDHAGYIPRLAAEGYRGPIHCTDATRDLAGIALRDAAKIQEEDAARAKRYGYSKHDPPLPLYTARDVEAVLPHFRATEYGQWLDLPGGIRARFHNAGHILGSAFVEVVAPRAGGEVRIVFSGDIGRYGVELHADPDPLPACDALVIESTYGDRIHPNTPFIDQVRKPFDDTIARRGTILIPAFAVARDAGVDAGARRADASPASSRASPSTSIARWPIAVTRVYGEHLQTGGLDSGIGDGPGARLFTDGVQMHSSVEESKRLNDLPGPRIIIASSGMLTGGRVLHHLERLAPDPKNLIALVGFQAEGTRGRALLGGATSLRLHGHDVPVRARVLSVEGLSAHADADELMRWFHTAPTLPRTAFVTHGEVPAAHALALRIESAGTPAHEPRMGEQFEVG